MVMEEEHAREVLGMPPRRAAWPQHPLLSLIFTVQGRRDPWRVHPGSRKRQRWPVLQQRPSGMEHRHVGSIRRPRSVDADSPGSQDCNEGIGKYKDQIINLQRVAAGHVGPCTYGYMAIDVCSC